MKVARVGRPFQLASLGGLSTGGGTIGGGDLDGIGFPGPGTVPTATGSNTWAWGSNVAQVTVNGATVLTGPFLNFANGSNTTVTADVVGAVASNTIRIHATGGGSVSFGSNATHVAEVSAGGASSDSARMDHYHAGIAQITASSSNTLQRGTVNLRPGTNVGFGLTDTDGDGEFDTLTITASATGGGGSSGGGGYPLDSYSIDATYGDDFDGAALDAIWTRRNFTSGAETYQLPPGGSHMRIVMTSRAVGDGYFQTAPGGDWTFAMAYINRLWNQHTWSLCVVNSVGTGVGVEFADVGGGVNACIVAAITTYSTYGGSFQQTGGTGSLQPQFLRNRKVWTYLRKSGTNYYAAFSIDGETWSPETPAFSSAITVDRVGMIVHPQAAITTTAQVDVDWFNKIA